MILSLKVLKVKYSQDWAFLYITKRENRHFARFARGMVVQ